MPSPPPPPLAPATAPLRTLPEELLEEVFLRLPPDEPASLVRASLASKLWLGLLAGPAFQGRYREFHGAPPMLGFFYCQPRFSESLEKETDPLFLSTTKFEPRISSEVQGWRSYGCDVLDCRHGRVLLGDSDWSLTGKLTVSDPMTGSWWDLRVPSSVQRYGAAVVCAVTGCDHRACHGGPFRVVFVELDQNTYARVWLSSPETGECSDLSSDFQPGKWGEAVSGFHIEGHSYIEPMCSVLVQDALHFKLVCIDDYDHGHVGILKYDLSSNCLSLIDAPLDVDTSGATILMAMEDGSLGFACVDGLTLHLWSRQLGSDGAASWTECKVINLKEILPILEPENRIKLIGSVEGWDIIFVNTDLGIYEINLKKLQWKKIWKREDICTLVPYMSFYIPEELSCDASTIHG